MTGHESPGTFYSRPSEANLVICSCSSLISYKRKDVWTPVHKSQSLIHASHSGKCLWSAFIVAGLHLSLEMGFWDSCIALHCSLSVKKDVGLGFAHFLDTAYIQLWVIAVDPKTWSKTTWTPIFSRWLRPDHLNLLRCSRRTWGSL